MIPWVISPLGSDSYLDGETRAAPSSYPRSKPFCSKTWSSYAMPCLHGANISQKQTPPSHT